MATTLVLPTAADFWSKRSESRGDPDQALRRSRGVKRVSGGSTVSCFRIIDRPTESIFPLEMRPHILGVHGPLLEPPPFFFFLPPWFCIHPGLLSAKIATAELLSIFGSTASGLLKRDFATKVLSSHLRPPSKVKLLGWSR